MKIDRNQLLSVGILWRTGIDGATRCVDEVGRGLSQPGARRRLTPPACEGTASDVAPGHGAARRRSGGVTSAGERSVGDEHQG